MATKAAEPPRFVDDYLPALLAQASQLISSEFHEVARQHGFSVSEWRVMASLAGGEPISIGQLAQVTGDQAADGDAPAGPHGSQGPGRAPAPRQ